MWKFILGNEKAIVGGATAGALTLLALVGVTSQMTIKDGVAALTTWLFTHAMVWLTTNSKRNVLAGTATSMTVTPINTEGVQ